MSGMRDENRDVIYVGEEEFKEILSRFPLEGQVSFIEETEYGYVIRCLYKREEDYLEGGEIVVEKTSFDLWWEKEREEITIKQFEEAYGNYYLPEVKGRNIEFNGDFWQEYGPITSTTGAPSARDRHKAVWTGSEMIVWGGYGTNSNYLCNGGIYVIGCTNPGGG